MKVGPITLRAANQFVAELHRHHKPTQGHKWSIGLYNEDRLVGVAIVGRPVSRYSDDGLTAEVTRLCTDGTKNACSALYGACARIAKEMGYHRIQTYILESENGASVKAAGWKLDGITQGGQWSRSDGSKRRTDQPTEPKHRYVRVLVSESQ